ncbi:MAG TPA: DUF1080 domain-containing protein [Roseimicrobium sp.]|nr:DUF1080 domain-containing protein [Roseimicrobium sp.]
MNRLTPFLFAGALLFASLPGGAMAAETKPTATPEPAADTGKPLFDGKTLAGWKPTGYAGGGEVKVEKGELLIDQGETLSGVTFTNAVLRMNYEISLEAKRVSGSDFFCGLTFPVGTNCVTLVVGGWGGAVTGISSIDHQDASDNETTKYIKYDTGKWYPIKVRVTPDKIQVWI